MASRWCPYCETSWPDEMHYRICPSCREDTRHILHGPRKVPLHPAEAVTRERQAEFGWWLWDTGRL